MSVPGMNKDTYHQRCPLCSNPAEYRSVDPNTAKHFYCTNCGQFRISVAAEKRIEKGPTHWKLTLSKAARDHPYGHTLVITLPEDKEQIGLSHAYVINSEFGE